MTRTVLLVDDDPHIRETAVDIVEDAGYVIRTAGSAAEALQSFAQAPAALVISDFNLPDMSGVELAKKIHNLAPATRIILMTGEQGLSGDLLQGPIQDILTKPVAPQTLLALIKQSVDQ